MTHYNYPTPTASPYADFLQYIPLLISAVEVELVRPEVWDDADAVTALRYMQELLAYLMELNPMNGLVSRVDLWHHNAIVEAGAAIALSAGTAQVFNVSSFQNPGALNDRWSHPVRLQAGLYTVKMIYSRTTGQGRLSLYVRQDGDEDQIGGFYEGYAAVAAQNVIESTGHVIPADGDYDIVGKVEQKHASSSGYAFRPTVISLFRTGEVP